MACGHNCGRDASAPRVRSSIMPLRHNLSLAERFLNENAIALRGAHMAQLAMYAAADRRHRRRRDVCATQLEL